MSATLKPVRPAVRGSGIEEQKIDEDTVLMDSVYQLNCPLVDMSPIAVGAGFHTANICSRQTTRRW